MECPAAASHYGSVVGRLNDYCIAANALNVGNLLSLGECSGLQSTFDSCKAAGSCSACNGENPPPTPPVGNGPGNYNYCGLNWADANSQCSETCYGGTNAECSSGSCFADATACAMVYDGTAAPSPNPTPNPTDAPVTEAPTQPPTTANPTQSPTEQVSSLCLLGQGTFSYTF